MELFQHRSRLATSIVAAALACLVPVPTWASGPALQRPQGPGAGSAPKTTPKPPEDTTKADRLPSAVELGVGAEVEGDATEEEPEDSERIDNPYGVAEEADPTPRAALEPNPYVYDTKEGRGSGPPYLSPTEVKPTPPARPTPAPDLPDSLTPSELPEPDPSLLEAAWSGVDGFDVDLELLGGRQMRGRVGAIQMTTFTLVEHETGAVLVLPKDGVTAVRAHRHEPLPKRTGTGLLVVGAIFTGIGAPALISGLAVLPTCGSCSSAYVPLLVTGGVSLAAGIPMLIAGVRRNTAFRRAILDRGLAPMVMGSRKGVAGGVGFRF